MSTDIASRVAWSPLNGDTLEQLVSALRSARSPLAVCRIARHYFSTLFELRLAVEAYLSDRFVDFNSLEPLRLVNAIALFYDRSGRSSLAREILILASRKLTNDDAWTSQTLVNIVRVDRQRDGCQFLESVFYLASYLINNEVSLRLSEPTIETVRETAYLSLFDVQAITLARCVVLSPSFLRSSDARFSLLEILTTNCLAMHNSDLEALLKILLSSRGTLSLTVLFCSLEVAERAPVRFLTSSDLTTIRINGIDNAL